MSYIIVFFISMVPLIELRGAIPYAIAQGLPYVPSYIIAILGNMLPVPFIYFFARKVLVWGSDKPVIGKFFTFCLEKGIREVRYFSISFQEPEHGQGHLRQAFWIWILSPVSSQSCSALCSPASSWDLHPQDCSGQSVHCLQCKVFYG